MDTDGNGRLTQRRLALSVATLAGCIAGIGALLPPAVAATSSAPATEGRPSVSLEGRLDTSSLPAGPATSALVVRNTGPVPVQWTVRARLDGTGASGARIEVLAPVGGTCTITGSPLPGWSAAPLAPGAVSTVCVRISVVGSVVGVVTPTATVDARQA